MVLLSLLPTAQPMAPPMLPVIVSSAVSGDEGPGAYHRALGQGGRAAKAAPGTGELRLLVGNRTLEGPALPGQGRARQLRGTQFGGNLVALQALLLFAQ